MDIIIAQILGVVVVVLSLITPHLKKMIVVLLIEFLMNLLVAIQYIFLQEFTGAYICLVSVVHSILLMLVNKFISEKIVKSVKIIISIIFVICYVLVACFTFKNLFDLLPLTASILFTLSIFQSNVKAYSVLMIIKAGVFGVYDIYSKAFVNIITRFLQIGSGLISICKKNENKEV